MEWYDNEKLIKEWDIVENQGINYKKYTLFSHKKVFWKCERGHKWSSEIWKRVQRGDGCPYCSGKRVIPGETDLQTLKPEIAKEWDYKQNNGLFPTEVRPHSNKKVFWICSKGHSYKSIISDRTRGKGCPYCSGNLPIKGENDLATKHPELVKEWDFENNSKLPDEYTCGSSKKVSWICEKGHKWNSTIKDRVKKGVGCPYCAHRIVSPGETDFKTKYPDLAKEWDYSNNKKTPESYLAHSPQKVYWICKKGHIWKASIFSRVQGNGCPYCAGFFPIKGETDLESQNPSLASEWNYDLNILKPCDVTLNSNKKVYWICDKGHSWKTSVDKRNNGTGCPKCSKKEYLLLNN